MNDRERGRPTTGRGQQITLTLSTELLARIDQVCASQTVKPPRTHAIIAMIERGLREMERGE